MKLAPKTATVERNGAEMTVPIEQVAKDDVFLVRPGESIPVDGMVIDGSSAVMNRRSPARASPLTKRPEVRSRPER